MNGLLRNSISVSCAVAILCTQSLGAMSAAYAIDPSQIPVRPVKDIDIFDKPPGAPEVLFDPTGGSNLGSSLVTVPPSGPSGLGLGNGMGDWGPGGSGQGLGMLSGILGGEGNGAMGGGLLAKFAQFAMILQFLKGSFGGQMKPSMRTAQGIANLSNADAKSSSPVGSLPGQGVGVPAGLVPQSPNLNAPVGPDVDGCGDTKSFNSNVDIDTDGRGKRVPGQTELPETSLKLGGQSVNSDKVNFIVMPGNCREHLGKYASVEYRGEKVYGIVADCGPAGKTGEMSTSMAKELSDKLHANGKGDGVPKFVGDGDADHYKGFADDGKAKYTILPGEVDRNKPITNDEIRQGALAQENAVAAKCGKGGPVALSPASAASGSLAGSGYTF